MQVTGGIFIVTILIDFLFRLNSYIRNRGEVIATPTPSLGSIIRNASSLFQVEDKIVGNWFNFAVNMFLILWWICGEPEPAGFALKSHRMAPFEARLLCTRTRGLAPIMRRRRPLRHSLPPRACRQHQSHQSQIQLLPTQQVDPSSLSLLLGE